MVVSKYIVGQLSDALRIRLCHMATVLVAASQASRRPVDVCLLSLDAQVPKVSVDQHGRIHGVYVVLWWSQLFEQGIKRDGGALEHTMYLYMRFRARNLSSGNLSHVSPTACSSMRPYHGTCAG